jgi:hypothetical protein
METQHLLDDILESYVMDRLQADEIEQTENHLLVCEHCRTRLEETRLYVQATKTAASRIREAEESFRARKRARAEWWANVLRGRPALGLAAALAVIVVIVVIPIRQTRSVEYELLNLRSTRGVEPSTPVGSRDRLLKLNLDVASLQTRNPLHISLVNSQGKQLWESVAPPPAGEQLQVTLPGKLNKGQYWVRLYGGEAGDQMLREYSLPVK